MPNTSLLLELLGQCTPHDAGGRATSNGQACVTFQQLRLHLASQDSNAATLWQTDHAFSASMRELLEQYDLQPCKFGKVLALRFPEQDISTLRISELITQKRVQASAHGR